MRAAMKRYGPHMLISAVAVALAIAHIGYPSARIDGIILGLIAIALLPWLGSVFKSIELPGGLKVEYPELERAGADAAEAGLLAAVSKKKEEPAYVAIAQEDPNLALAGLRIEIERRLRTIAAARALEVERRGISQLLRVLRTQNVLSPNEDGVLNDLVGLLNRAVHGAEADPRAAQWAIEVGPQLLAALDDRVSKEPN